MQRRTELTSSYRRMKGTTESLSGYSKENKTCAQMAFIASVTPIFMRFLKLLQSSGPLIHVLYSELKDNLPLVMKRFLKHELISGKSGRYVIQIDINNVENLKPIAELEIGEPTKCFLQKMSGNQVFWFEERGAEVLQNCGSVSSKETAIGQWTNTWLDMFASTVTKRTQKCSCNREDSKSSCHRWLAGRKCH